MGFFSQFFKQFGSFWNKIGFNQKIIIVFMFFVFVGIIWFTTMLAKRPDYALLYSNISESDSAQIVNKLRDAKVPYMLKDNGKSVYVPSEKVYDMRIAMANDGLPQGSGMGYELFDKANFGMTDFVQRLNYTRALQGELSRTISQLNEIESARVQIVMPEEKLFNSGEQKTSASIFLKLKTGSLSSSQINGIVNLVASSVENLSPDNITVIDSLGNLLSSSFSDSGSLSKSKSQIELQETVERRLSQKVQTMLEGVLGPESAIVRVSALLNYEEIEKTQELYDPEGAVVRTETISSESQEGSSGGISGASGIVQNQATGAQTQSSGKNNKKNKEVIKNSYEINRTVQRILKQAGDIKRLTISVFIKQKTEIDADGNKKSIERSADEISSFENIVKRALGYDESRGDEMILKEIEFNDDYMANELKMIEKASQQQFFLKIGKYVMTGLVTIILFLFISKMLKNSKLEVVESGIPVGEGGGGEMALAAMSSPQKSASHAQFQAQIEQLVQEEPEKVAMLLKNWLAEE